MLGWVLGLLFTSVSSRVYRVNLLELVVEHDHST